MSDKQSMGIVLKHLGGEGPVEIMTTKKDFNLQTVTGPQGPMDFPADTLVAFTAQKFREMGESDIWEFVVLAPSQAGPVKAYMYLRAEDIFIIRMLSKVA